MFSKEKSSNALAWLNSSLCGLPALPPPTLPLHTLNSRDTEPLVAPEQVRLSLCSVHVSCGWTPPPHHLAPSHTLAQPVSLNLRVTSLGMHSNCLSIPHISPHYGRFFFYCSIAIKVPIMEVPIKVPIMEVLFIAVLQ